MITNSAYPDWSSKSYLVIDDFSIVHRMMRDMLRKLGAKAIDTVKNGADAISLLRLKQYDVVLCDYNFSEGPNGQQILEEARHRELIGLTCIWIMVSSEKAVETVMGAAEQAPDGYILKPLTESLLLARLNRAWDRKQAFTAIERAYAARNFLLAANLCDEALAKAPLHAMDLLRMKATLLLKAGQLQAARKVYEIALELREQVWAKAGLARLDSLEGRHAEAKRRLTEIVHDHPSFLDAYDQLAQVLQQLGEYVQALEVLEQAARLSPYSVVRQKNLGDVAALLGKFDIAEEAYLTSIAVGEYSIMKSADAYLGLAKLYGKIDRIPDAQALLNTVRQCFPSEQIISRAADLEQQLTGTIVLPPAKPIPSPEQARPADISATPGGKVNEPFAPDAVVKPSTEQSNVITGAVPGAVMAPAIPAQAQALHQRAQVLMQYMKTNGYNLVSAEEVRAVLRRADKIAPQIPRTMELLSELEQMATGRH
ncbi:tetratricopeptide repeat protein [Paucimonas lemoignei]|uniref:Tetratricopeptide repeat protein n=1 Tax=Paucimonas lemoignei TaxID=29443 RepID=A0A4R3I0J3_PAULE|nr:response regulator [Paucimonas lemoignei]TCS39216.1 tetratricopeptide repeat protein [Paucimonas lemoignei]